MSKAVGPTPGRALDDVLRAPRCGDIVVRREPREHFVNVIESADVRALISLDLLVRGDDDYISLDSGGSVVTIEAENGMLKYEVVEWDRRARALICILIFSTVPGIEV